LSIHHNTSSTNLADLLERVLDKGIVISGDIRVKIVDIELLTIELRLIICSVDKAREIGLDWWSFTGKQPSPELQSSVQRLEERLERMERLLTQQAQDDK
jgi:hypothetical protein